MNDNFRKVKARENWLKIYDELGSVTKASLRLGVARSTLYRWIKRFKEQGKGGLSDKSRRPNNLANQKVDDSIEKIILDCRKNRNWGPDRIVSYLLHKKRIHLSSMTVWRILKKHQVKPVIKQRKKSDYKRYSREIPGDRVQMDVTKLAPKAYQFTAIDDYTRMKYLHIYPNKRADSTVDFLGRVLDYFPFPVQRVQTDWGTEFFNYKFQEELHEHFIKFRPIKPRSPHLNGKVERTQQTDKVEFWNFIDTKDNTLNLNDLAEEWIEFYNHKRPHLSLKGKSPWQKYRELEKLIPIQPEVTQAFWDSEEEIKPRNAVWVYHSKYYKK